MNVFYYKNIFDMVLKIPEKFSIQTGLGLTALLKTIFLEIKINLALSKFLDEVYFS